MKVLLLLPLLLVLVSGLRVDPEFTRLVKKLQKFQTNGRIVGGQPTTIEQHPHQLAMYDSTFFFCAGCIVSDFWVLTAAHCLEDNPAPSKIQFRAGSTYRNASEGQLVTVVEFFLHPRYRVNRFPFDAAVARVDQAFRFSLAGINPIPIVESGFTPRGGQTVTVSGWGRDGNQQLPMNLHYVDVPIVTNTDCARSYPGSIDDSMFCAGVTGRDSCGGDSGGPISERIGSRQVLIGVVSWGSTRCGADGRPGVYTRIGNSEIHSFILQYVKF